MPTYKQPSPEDVLSLRDTHQKWTFRVCCQRDLQKGDVILDDDVLLTISGTGWDPTNLRRYSLTYGDGTTKWFTVNCFVVKAMVVEDV